MLGSTPGLSAIKYQVLGHSCRVGHELFFTAWDSSSTRVWLVTPASFGATIAQHILEGEQIVGQFCGCVDVQVSFPYPAEYFVQRD